MGYITLPSVESDRTMQFGIQFDEERNSVIFDTMGEGQNTVCRNISVESARALARELSQAIKDAVKYEKEEARKPRVTGNYTVITHDDIQYFLPYSPNYVIDSNADSQAIHDDLRGRMEFMINRVGTRYGAK